MNSKPSVIDLCCGAGGLSEGFKQAGFNISLAIDKNEDAVLTFSSNHKETKCLIYDLNLLKPNKLKKILKMNELKNDIIVAGLPCKPFSAANRRGGKYFSKYVSLVEKVSTIIVKTKPSWFVIENVLPFLTMHNGYYKRILEERTTSAGYFLKYQKLNAYEYGVPQIRKRVFIIGNNYSDNFLLPKQSKSQISSEEALSDLPFIINKSGEDVTNYDKKPQTSYQQKMRTKSKKLHNHVVSHHGSNVKERFSFIKEGENYQKAKIKAEFPENLLISGGFSNSYKRLDRNKPAPTMANPRKNLFIHYSVDRSLSIREVARLQSFKDTYLFKGNKSSQQQQVADSVPPLMAKALASSIKKLM